jgi:hypothetical protein
MSPVECCLVRPCVRAWQAAGAYTHAATRSARACWLRRAIERRIQWVPRASGGGRLVRWCFLPPTLDSRAEAVRHILLRRSVLGIDDGVAPAFLLLMDSWSRCG